VCGLPSWIDANAIVVQCPLLILGCYRGAFTVIGHGGSSGTNHPAGAGWEIRDAITYNVITTPDALEAWAGHASLSRNVSNAG